MSGGAFSHSLTRACAWVLGLAACAAFASAPGATPALAAEPCANEQRRQESNTNPATRQPYSTGLPECRAYEMVSPPYKQSSDVKEAAPLGIPVAPDGETVGFTSQGDFAGAEDYAVNVFPTNAYLARRGASGWITSSTFAPRTLVDHPDNLGLNADFSPDLRSVEVSCGYSSPVLGEVSTGTGVVCAKRTAGGAWVSTALHMGADELNDGDVATTTYIGGSSDFSRVILQPSVFHLLSGDTCLEGIYELAGVATDQEQVRLVNVDNGGKELFYTPINGNCPFVGFGPRNRSPEGSRYHAISESGGTVFFTAIPNEEQLPAGEKATLYARVGAEKTVAVSNPSPSECTGCSLAAKPAQPAAFQGASADGSKVFFTTAQPLLKGDTDTTNDLYEYDFNPPPGQPQLVQVSGGAPSDTTPGAGAKVLGVLRNSPDGSHVYFVAQGVLTNEEIEGRKAEAGKPNLYGYDTRTGQTKFVATLSLEDNRPCPTSGAPCELWGGLTSRDHTDRSLQTTPDGRYLVFSSFAQLAKDTNSGAAYRYDFETGELTWISHAATGFAKPKEEGKPAIIAPLDGTDGGATVAIDDFSRAISKNGEYVVFTTSERLQAGAEEGVSNVYLWHNGTVSMISSGGGVGTGEAAMSSSGSDIFFTTAIPLVGQDTDLLRDVYDARIGGGFPAPPAEPSCSLNACQGKPSKLPLFEPSTSSLVPAGGNPAPPKPSLPPVEEKKKKLTPAQELAKALAACKHEPKSKRAACESQARRRYAAQQLAAALKACKSKPKTKRAACESQAKKRYRR
jgi:hypothetical protein